MPKKRIGLRQARLIKKMIMLNRGVLLSKIAKKFKVSNSTVSNINQGYHWSTQLSKGEKK